MAASPSFLHEKALSKQTLDDLDGAFCNILERTPRHCSSILPKTCHVIYSLRLSGLLRCVMESAIHLPLPFVTAAMRRVICY
ncbi:hypothetical protein ISN45_Aa01g022050, partial [Arabidopsis thaliana x Arabidopsis arenosa]